MALTIKEPASAELKILRSQFICALYPVESPEEARLQLGEHNQLYSDATHNCYAYICGFNQETSYYSDAGEPGGTAGKPILNALLRHQLTNILAVVTRYYGGIKLGVKGLIEAYGAAVEEGVYRSELVTARKFISITQSCEYSAFASLKHKAAELEAEFSQVEYARKVSFVISVPSENEAALQGLLKLL